MLSTKNLAPLPPGVPLYLLQARPLVLASLPRKPTDEREVTRRVRTGRTRWLTVTYIATDFRYRLPFGADRTLLAWITTKAYRDGWVRFHAVSEYFKTFGLGQGGRSYEIFRERFQRIANLALRLETVDNGTRTVRRLFLVPVSEEPEELLDGTPGLLRRVLGQGSRYRFQVDPEFWAYLSKNPVPVDTRILKHFKNAPRLWDIAQVQLYRNHVAGREIRIPLGELASQLGLEAVNGPRLKAEVRKVAEFLRSCR